MKNHKTYNKIIKGIKDYFKENKFKKAVLGLSGGVDSSLSCKLVRDALGNNNVHGLIMPEKGVTKTVNIKDAIELVKKLKIKHTLIYINDFLKPFNKVEWEQNKYAKINIKARIRATLLYNYANSNKALVIGTSNKSELLLGYFTKYGDGAVDNEVIGSLFKTEVIKLAKFLCLPKRIINKTPSAELYKGHSDEQELGASYELIDKILIDKFVDKKNNNYLYNKYDKKIVDNILSLVEKNKHKREIPFIIKII
jgi:NAD+ synthase